MTQVMMGDSDQIELMAGGINGLLTFTNLHDRCIHPLFLLAFRTYALKDSPHIRNHRNPSDFPIFSSGGGIAMNRDLPFLEVTVVPVHACRLALAATAICKKLGEIRTALTKPASG